VTQHLDARGRAPFLGQVRILVEIVQVALQHVATILADVSDGRADGHFIQTRQSRVLDVRGFHARKLGSQLLAAQLLAVLRHRADRYRAQCEDDPSGVHMALLLILAPTAAATGI
jgi:hypothetical protein